MIRQSSISKIIGLTVILVVLYSFNWQLGFINLKKSEKDNELDIPTSQAEVNELFESLDQGPSNIDTSNLRIPFSGFTENKGQITNSEIQYYYSSTSSAIGFSNSQIHMNLISSIISNDKTKGMTTFANDQCNCQGSKESLNFVISFPGSNDIKPSGINRYDHKTNYFLGNSLITNVRSTQEVYYHNLYENIDLRYYMSDQGLKYDFIVYPKGDPDQIEVKVSSNIKISVMEKKVNFYSSGKFANPIIIDDDLTVFDGLGNIVEAQFKTLSSNSYGFNILQYDKSNKIIIDPVWIGFSTFIGGNGVDQGISIAIDENDDVYLTGYTDSSDFLILNQYQTHFSNIDIFITKISGITNELIYSTYIGASGFDRAFDIVVDKFGNAHVGGSTTSSDFPVINPFQATFNQGPEAFLLKLNSSGNGLLYSTFIGGNGFDQINGITIDSSNGIYVVGETSSSDFPILNEYQSYQSVRDVFIAKFNSTGNGLIFSTYLGGNSNDIAYDVALDATSNVYIVGSTESTDFPIINEFQTNQPNLDTFVVKLNSTGNGLIFSTYLGGSLADEGHGITVDSENNTIITGFTTSANYPTFNPYQVDSADSNFDVFITKLNSTGNGLNFSTYIGGNSVDKAYDVEIDKFGNVFIIGSTSSNNFPLMDEYQEFQFGNDAFVLKLNSTGTGLKFSSYFGGSQADVGRSIAIDNVGNLYFTGSTDSANYPLINEYQTNNGSTNAFLTKISVNTAGSYLGGNSAEIGNGIFVDSNGNIYIIGQTTSLDFPILNPYQGLKTPGIDFVISKFNMRMELVFSTFLGGNGHDIGNDIKVDNDGNIYFTGESSSSDFPIVNYFQALRPFYNVVFGKLNSTGNGLLFSSYLGGNQDDFGKSLVVDDGGNLYITGQTGSTDFPTKNPIQIDEGDNNADIFVTKINSTGNGLIYSTYISGNSRDTGKGIALDMNGSIYITGDTESTDFPLVNPIMGDSGIWDIFVSKLSPEGDSLIYSTYVGGNAGDRGEDIAVDNVGSVYVVGYTSSSNFPTYNSLQGDTASSEAVIFKLNTTGNGFIFSTLFGGNSVDTAFGIDIDSKGNSYITGNTLSTDLILINEFQGYQGSVDNFILKLNSAGDKFEYSTYVGGSSDEYSNGIFVDRSENIYITGQTFSNDYPAYLGHQTNSSIDQHDLFVFRLGNPIDNEIPTIKLISPSENSSLKSGTPIEFHLDDNILIDDVIYNWDNGINRTGIITQPINDGNHTLYLYVRDAANNWNSAIQSFVTDDSVPASDQPSDKIIELGSTGNFVTWVVSDKYSSIYNITLNNNFLLSSGSWGNGTLGVSLDGYGIGNYSIRIQLTDIAGNYAADEVKFSIVDTISPLITNPVDLILEISPITTSISWIGNDLNHSTYQIFINGLELKNGSWISDQPIILDLNGLLLGYFNFTIVLFDISGNSNSDTVYVIVNPSEPEISNPSDITYEIGSVTQSIIWVGSDLEPDSYEVFIDDVSVENGNWENGTDIIFNLDNLNVGAHNITIILFDLSENSVIHQVLVTVLDTTAPTIISQEDFSYEFGTVENLITWIANDLDSDIYQILHNGTEIISSQWVSDSNITLDVDNYDLGLHNLTIIVYDTSNNVKINTVFLEVKDTINPVFNETANQALNNEIIAGGTMIIVIEDLGVVTRIDYSWNGGSTSSAFPKPSTLTLAQIPNQYFFEINVPENVSRLGRISISAYDTGGNVQTFFIDVVIMGEAISNDENIPRNIYIGIIGFSVLALFGGVLRLRQRRKMDKVFDDLQLDFESAEMAGEGKND